jgi:hypothetical protein
MGIASVQDGDVIVDGIEGWKSLGGGEEEP